MRGGDFAPRGSEIKSALNITYPIFSSYSLCSYSNIKKCDFSNARPKPDSVALNHKAAFRGSVPRNVPEITVITVFYSHYHTTIIIVTFDQKHPLALRFGPHLSALV